MSGGSTQRKRVKPAACALQSRLSPGASWLYRYIHHSRSPSDRPGPASPQY